MACAPHHFLCISPFLQLFGSTEKCFAQALQKGSTWPWQRAQALICSHAGKMEKKEVAAWKQQQHQRRGDVSIGDLFAGALCQWHVSILLAHEYLYVLWQLWILHKCPAVALSPLCILFGTQGPSIQALAMAALKSGQNSSDIQEMASLGNSGQNPNHVAQQLERKYCQAAEIDVPNPYSVECPVLLRTSDGMSVATRNVGMFLPHEWFHWMCQKDGVSGLSHLEGFWYEHSPKDPQIQHPPVTDTWVAIG